MLQALKKLFGLGKAPVDFKQLLKEGGIVVDVRSKGEFAGGHVKNAINLPLDSLSTQLTRLKNKEQPIITCCASGMRSASAKSILKAKGYTKVYNGGSWLSVQRKLA